MNLSVDQFYMAHAIHLAQKGIYTTDPNPYVGCVLVKDGKIIAEGWTQRAGFAHAEVHALAQTNQAQGATAYVSLEPCSHTGRTGPCCDALINAGVTRVVVAMQDPNPLVAGQGLEKIKAAGIEVCTGVLADEAAVLNPGFFKRMQQGLPFIRSKLACSLDGRTAMASGESQWITSESARQDVHRWRAQSSAIMTGVDTVIADDPLLNARVAFDLEQPVRVILDTHLRLPLSAKLLQQAGETWLFTSSNDQFKLHALRDKGCKIIQLPVVNGRLDLLEVFKQLAFLQINSVWVEAGATLNGALLETGLVDEWLIYMAPCVLGDQARGLFHLPTLQALVDKKQLRWLDVRTVGTDLRLSFKLLTN